MKLKRKSLARIKDLVKRARSASGNDKYDLARMPKGHWMRTDQAKRVRKARVDQFGKYRSGIKSHT